MLIQLGQVSLYRCQSNQWFINRRAKTGWNAREKDSDGGHRKEREREKEKERQWEHCIAKRIGENRQANSEKGGRWSSRGLKGRPVGSRFVWTVDLNTWSRGTHASYTLVKKGRKRVEGQREGAGRWERKERVRERPG